MSKNYKGIIKAMNKKVKMVYVETPTNPCLTIVDIEKIAKICKKNKIIFIVDNTFASPYI